MRHEDAHARGAPQEVLRSVARASPEGLARPSAGGLDDRTRALVCLSAALAIGSPPVVVRPLVTQSLAAGATTDDVVAILVTLAPMIGSARVVAAAPDVALAIGYDVDLALEATDRTIDG